MHTLKSRLPIALALSLLLMLTLSAPAFGDPLSAKKAQAARVQAQVSRLNDKAEIAAEKYNAARARYRKLTDKVRSTEKQIAKLKKKQHFLQGHLDTRASEMYRQGPLGFMTVLLSVRSFEQLDTTMRVLTSLNEQDAANVAQLKSAKAEAQAARATLLVAKKDAGRQKDAMADNKRAVEGQLAARKRVLSGLTADIQSLIAQEIAKQRAEEQARTMALLLAQRSASSGGITLGGTPPSDKAAAAVYWAEKQLGKPYVWAADGPSTFDCSGLMLFAYAKVGIHLTHYSGQQIKEGAKVSRSNLQPGDLVFFGHPIHHVGMYVGGGNFIEAPYSGANVRITRLSRRSDYAGACRPTSR
jgi:peptidoglycan DL-endopeptidase CwlO